ncbi:nucleoside-diphosphate-sugar epimerases [Candidatus Scalindua japonica]|uniref:Nucleoside-diphosphate-sugar epimerases n=1 Tax=Candidatus Scalindua japonica TaxID=1284222 RepID=A0A286U1J0_9BACT|nr:hypothetical protein [Candidatus Scalindua japonica]GAX61994.1 nucleoside-diphosphate-sugar epimerases [Candidatus Scalindua japonica]
MNTLITYQYRDASNYKEYDTVIISGLLSLNDVEEYLYEKELFIPSEIGLKDLQPDNLNQDDHIWHEILEIKHSHEKPTVNISAEEIVSHFRKASLEEWNILEASKRIGLST